MTVDKINVYDTVKNKVENANANAKNDMGDNLNLQLTISYEKLKSQISNGYSQKK